MSGPNSLKIAPSIAALILLFLLSVISLLLLPILIFAFFGCLTLLALTILLLKLFPRKTLGKDHSENVHGTADKELLIKLEEMQRKSKGKKIERH